jgi:two-component system response regulator
MFKIYYTPKKYNHMNPDRTDILLVEDNEQEAKLAIYNLKKHNLTGHLKHLKDGGEAVDFIFGRGGYAGRDMADSPKVILLDINLPKVSGLEILRLIKGDERTRSIPVVILTSSEDCSDVAAGYALGTDSYIVKPIEFDVFSKTIYKLGLYQMLNVPPHISVSLWQSIGEA